MTEIFVSKPQEEVLRSTSDRILFLAGQGSGKTYEAGLISSDFIINHPSVRGFIGANTYGQLSKSTLDRIFKVWLSTFKWSNGTEYVVDKIPPAHFKRFGPQLKSYENTISFNNGCLIYTASLDNYKVIDGTEFCWAILDETKDTKEEAVKEVITGRLREVGIWVDADGIIYSDKSKADKLIAEGREIKGWNPLYIMTSPAKVDWINEWFELGTEYDEISRRIFSKTDYYSRVKDGKHVVISSAYHNESNLPPGFIEQRKRDLIGTPNLIDMLIYGSPIAKAGGEFFSMFDRTKHVGKVEFLPDHNVHISLDFNLVPYITMTCWQIVRIDERYQVRCFKELCLSSPMNNTEDLCKQFKREVIDGFKIRYPNHNKFPGLFYYGDATGKTGNTSSREHNYEVLERVLSPWLNDSSNRVLRSNPRVVETRDFMNKALAGGLPIDLIINEGCKNLLADIEFLKEAPDGGKLIVHATDPITKQKYEKYGHTSDSARYFVVSAFEGLFDKN